MTQPNLYSDNHEETTRSSAFNSAWIVGALIVLIPVGAALYYLFDWNEEVPVPANIEIKQTDPTPIQHVQAPPPVPAQKIEQPLMEEPAEVIAASPPEPEPAPPPLPDLNNSDQDISLALSHLSDDTALATWFNTSEIVRKIVVLTDNATQGKLAKKYLFIPGPSAKFSTYKKADREYISPASYARYDGYLDLINSIDIDGAVSLYRRYQPLLDQAFAELGYPNRTFHKTLIATLDTLLAAPVTKKDLEVTRPSVMYKYVDPDLETLPAVHKQLLRIGPDNARRLQRKLRQFKTALEQ